MTSEQTIKENIQRNLDKNKPYDPVMGINCLIICFDNIYSIFYSIFQ